MTAALHLVAEPPAEDPEHLDEWELMGRAAGWADKTFTTRLSSLRLLRAHAGVSLREISPGQLAAFLTSNPDWRPETRATRFRSARSYYTWLKKAGYRADDPTEAIRPPKVPPAAPRPVSTVAIEDALQHCKTARAYAYIVLGAFAGLRVHEIAKVRGEDIDLDAGTLFVVGKGGREGIIPLHPAVAMLARGLPDSGYWFPGVNGGHVVSQSVSHTIGTTFERAGIKMTPHQLRHWFGTQALKSSQGNLRIAQELLRHASPTTTARYTMVEDKERRAAVMGLPEVSGTLGVAAERPVRGEVLRPPEAQLSGRQQQVLEGIAEGLTRLQMADRLDLAPSTVKNYVAALYNRLGVSTRGEAVAAAARDGYLQL